LLSNLGTGTGQGLSRRGKSGGDKARLWHCCTIARVFPADGPVLIAFAAPAMETGPYQFGFP